MSFLKLRTKGIVSATFLFQICLLFNCQIKISFAQNSTYCNVSTYGAYAQNGTLCLYQGTIGPACGGRTNILRGNDTITPGAIDFIVDLHNVLRSRVAAGNETRGSPGTQPRARAMNALQWNAQLALAAQTWADQCLIASDVNRNETNTVVASPTTPVHIGQNVFGLVNSPNTYFFDENISIGSYWYQAILRWYNEVEMFDKRVVGNYVYQARVGHYTYMVHDLTTDIGCGFNQWRIGNTGRIARVHICNYGPGGNIPGQPVYVVGDTCSACRVNTTCQNSLCFG